MSIKSELDTIAKEYPRYVCSHLEQGSILTKSGGLTYILDNAQIHEELAIGKPGAVPANLIYMSLGGTQRDVNELFAGESQIPFSKAFNAGIGQCLEKAILAQLYAQSGDEPAYLVNGSLNADTNSGVNIFGAHAYNVIFREGKPFILDTQNPIKVDGEVTPYLVPVLGIKGEDFVLPKELANSREYSLF